MNIKNKYINVCKYYKLLLARASPANYIIENENKDTGKTKKTGFDIRGQHTPHLKSGLAGWCRWNSQYRGLIIDMEVQKWTNSGILEEFSTILNPHQIPESAIDRSQNRDVNMESTKDIELPVTPKTAGRIVYLRITQNWSMKSICSKFGVEKHQVAQIFKTI